MGASWGHTLGHFTQLSLFNRSPLSAALVPAAEKPCFIGEEALYLRDLDRRRGEEERGK